MSTATREREVGISVLTRKKFIRTLFPDTGLMRQPLDLLGYYGDVFSIMAQLERAGHFRIQGDRKLREKLKLATEITLYMFHPRVETYIATYPKSSRLFHINFLIRSWRKASLEDLREIRSEIIAMHSEGFPY